MKNNENLYICIHAKNVQISKIYVYEIYGYRFCFFVKRAFFLVKVTRFIVNFLERLIPVLTIISLIIVKFKKSEKHQRVSVFFF